MLFSRSSPLVAALLAVIGWAALATGKRTDQFHVAVCFLSSDIDDVPDFFDLVFMDRRIAAGCFCICACHSCIRCSAARQALFETVF